MAAEEIVIGNHPIDPQKKFMVKQVQGKHTKIDVREWWLPEDSSEFAPGKGARFPQNLAPGIACSILKAAKEDLAKNPKLAQEIMALCQAALAKEVV